jgi:LCP family protein required for cell wall assembly
LHYSHDDLEQGTLIKARNSSLRPMVHTKFRVNGAGQQLRTAKVDADGAPLRHAVTICSADATTMANEPRNPASSQDPPYRVYRGGSDDSSSRGNGGAARGGAAPYKVYRSNPRGLRSRLRGEDDVVLPGGGGDGGDQKSSGRRGGRFRGPITPRRVIKWVVLLIVAWVALSAVLFFVSAQQESGSLPTAAQNALTPGSNMVLSTDTVLVLGTDQRPTGTKEGGANTSDKGSRSDTMMLWRVGGGTSRRLSIPRDTMADIPGVGLSKINAAYAYGGPALAIRTVERFTGLKINHLIVVNLAAFPQFIDAIGGVDVTTGRICSNISGGVKNGGFTLNLRPGSHHLDGRDALTLARTRENACNASSNDLTREGYQQKILNAIKSKLLSPTTFFHLPWASWAAPKTLRTDMGPLTLLSLFVAAETGGSAPTQILGSNHLPLADPQSPAGQAAIRRAVNKLMNG